VELWQRLRDHDIAAELMDPSPWPLNPLAGRHSLFQSLDPYRAFKALLTRRNFDLVLALGEGCAAFLVALRKMLRFRPPILAWDISPDVDWKVRKHLQDHVMSRVDGILAIQSAQVPYIARRWGVPAWAVGYSVDTDFFHPRYNEPPRHILSVGEDAGRDFPTLLAAMRGLAGELVIKTKLPLQVDPRTRGNIRVLPEHLDYVGFRSLYARSHFVVLPLKPHPANASGVTTLAQAFAMGKAVIASWSDGIQDFLIPDQNCVVVPAGDVEALRSAMARLIRDPATCERLGRNARLFAERRFSNQAFAARFASTLRDTLKTIQDGRAHVATEAWRSPWAWADAGVHGQTHGRAGSRESSA
jgi:glycosyltransferase involved in cell wall biosynthesis